MNLLFIKDNKIMTFKIVSQDKLKEKLSQLGFKKQNDKFDNVVINQRDCWKFYEFKSYEFFLNNELSITEKGNLPLIFPISDPILVRYLGNDIYVIFITNRVTIFDYNVVCCVLYDNMQYFENIGTFASSCDPDLCSIIFENDSLILGRTNGIVDFKEKSEIISLSKIRFIQYSIVFIFLICSVSVFGDNYLIGFLLTICSIIISKINCDDRVRIAIDIIKILDKINIQTKKLTFEHFDDIDICFKN